MLCTLLEIYYILSVQNKIKLEMIQCTATEVIYPDLPDEERLALLNLPMLADIIFSYCKTLFQRVAANLNHPHHNRIAYNKARISSAILKDPSISMASLKPKNKRIDFSHEPFLRRYAK